MRNDLWSDDELTVVCQIYLRKNMTSSNKVRLAVLSTGRSEGSINRRFGNFQYYETGGEKGLANGGERALAVWNRFSDDPERLDAEAKRILNEGNIGSLSNTESERAVFVGTLELEGFNRERITEVRVNQNKLREYTLKYAGGRCCVTGISDPAFLIASHIKPWSVCEPKERTDPHNALCLNAFHDKLFDGYRMTVTGDMEIVYDPKLEETIPERVYRNMISGYTEIRVNENNRPGEKYLAYHNTRFSKITGVKI